MATLENLAYKALKVKFTPRTEKKTDETIAYSCFSTPAGADEFFITISTEPEQSFSNSLKELCLKYQTTIRSLGLSLETQVFSRVYLSDISNQRTELLRSEIFETLRNACFSAVQQCPMDGGDLTLFAYHIRGTSKNPSACLKMEGSPWQNAWKFDGNSYSMLWTGNMNGHGARPAFDQSNEIFVQYNNILNSNGMSLLKNGIRTWIYVRDIDNNYEGMVHARAAHFHEQGLNSETRFLASTGIEGRMKDTSTLVSMDTMAMTNLMPGQISRLSAPEHLCSAYDYGVTFERGLKLEFGDRAHLYISGTASIDPTGHLIHPMDVKRQTMRTLENIQALIQPHEGDLRDLAYVIIYLRNIKDVNKVLEVVRARLPEGIPMVVVEGAVCRPNWLVEIEGVAIISQSSPYKPFF